VDGEGAHHTTPAPAGTKPRIPRRRPGRLTLDTNAAAPSITAALVAEPAHFTRAFTCTALPPTAVAVEDLERRHCRWPLELEGAGTFYCGAPRRKGAPYCLAHADIAFTGRGYRVKGWS
jgi:hypothetical protein